MTLGAKLKKLRLERELHQKDVCDLIGISETSLSNYENDINEPKLKTLKKLLNLYQVNAEAFLIEGKEYLDISFYSPIGKRKALALHNEELQKRQKAIIKSITQNNKE